MQARAMRLFVAAFLSVLGLCAGETDEEFIERMYGPMKDLCNGNEIELRTISDLNRLLTTRPNWLKSKGCSDRVIEAVREMQGIVKWENPCQKWKVEELLEYVDTYIKEREGVERIPKQLADFAIAYGFKMESRCRDFVVNKYARKAKKYLTSDDYKALKPYTNHNSPIARLLNPITKLGEFILPSDLKQAVPGLDEEKFAIRVSDGRKFNHVKEICDQRITPIYEFTLLPLALLDRAGFNQQSGISSRMVAFPWLATDTAWWSRVVFLCEYLKDVDYVETVHDDKKEAKKKFSPNLLNKYGFIFADNTVGPEILPKDDPSFMAQVEKFDPNKDATERLQEKILESSFSLLVENAKYGEIMPLMSGLLSKYVCKVKKCSDEKDQNDVNEQLVKILDTKDYPKFYRSLKTIGLAAAAVPMFAYIMSMFVLVAPADFVNYLWTGLTNPNEYPKGKWPYQPSQAAVDDYKKRTAKHYAARYFNKHNPYELINPL